MAWTAPKIQQMLAAQMPKVASAKPWKPMTGASLTARPTYNSPRVLSGGDRTGYAR